MACMFSARACSLRLNLSLGLMTELELSGGNVAELLAAGKKISCRFLFKF